MSNFDKCMNFDGYQYFQSLKSCYNSIYDQASVKLFWARVRADLCFHPGDIDVLANTVRDNLYTPTECTITEFISDAVASNSPFIIYGAGKYGKKWCEYLQSISANLKGFFDQNYKNTPTCMGLPVFPPPECAEEFKDCYILVSAIDYIDQIRTFLLEHGFSSDKILCICSTKLEDTEHQYFEFPDKYPKGGAFVDAGCFDCGTSLRFVDWCEGAYSKIFAF